MIDKRKEKIINKRFQFIDISRNGIINESENNLFFLEKGTSIFEAHTFFEAISYYFEQEAGNSHHLTCVNFEIKGVTGIYDIDIDILEDNLIFMFLDLTSHYKSSQILSQERNESVIEGQILKEKEAFKNIFLANTSHELRTPLATIMGFTSILHRSSLTLDQLHNLNIIKGSCEQLKRVVDDILDISSIEMGQLKINNSRFDTTSFFKNLEFVYTVKSSEKNLKCSIVIDKKLPQFIDGDKLRLRQVLGNLLDNAINYTDKGAIKLIVKVDTTENDNVCVDFKVSDTGIGINKKDIHTIFESFERVNNKNNKGTGLGLAIVKKLVILMEGNIEVKSTPSKGTAFNVKLNFKISENQKAYKTIKSDSKKNDSKKKRNILIAEDLEVNQILMMRTLSDFGGFYFDIASNGDQVIKYLHKNKYDLILMDLKMPTMDGHDTTRFIRESSRANFKNIPIIAVTAKASSLEREQCLNTGMNDYITKPFNEKELLKKMNALLKIY
ncbi:response regulator [Algibacter amylolyticus]|uniref:histidine kinase n=1 Tax=Algibacter amylolyticus TaxID=1608400 RepID=A0A5M7BKR3_9FLAO|nr:ATP-binding protein [Algibacter amylolyticus]KAA5827565.1 response regulator [Algibacter amylolyticus]MBB5266771.1 signal transduction histidine kinase/CheY-like chemotaxis protein [Algibacter amylolyticus]TSJ81810.1 response regulator [Algibacter amylolyticus]